MKNCSGFYPEQFFAIPQWGCKKYMNMKHLEAIEDINAIA